MDDTPSILQRVHTATVYLGAGLLLSEGFRLLFSRLQLRRGSRKAEEHEKPLQSTGRAAVALLVDGENISSSAADFVVDVAQSHGEVIIKRVFGCCDMFNSSNKKNWRDASLRLDLEQHHLIRPTSGKKTADIALAVNAIELAKDGRCNCFCIVSSDSDFTPLTRELRALGCYVIVIGELEKAPDTLKEACNKFVSIDHLLSSTSATQTPTSVKRAKSTKSISTSPEPTPASSEAEEPSVSLLETVLEPAEKASLPASVSTVITQAYRLSPHGQVGEWVLLSQLGLLLRQLYPEFKPTDYAEDLSALIQSYDSMFEFRKRRNGHPEMRLRA
ncbi:MAG TPA: NYN domain-containing protein [Ktedonobacteraceae bacterium]|nr:NYN domain-containing protein [Ktedonobacteraceae bacterium]